MRPLPILLAFFLTTTASPLAASRSENVNSTTTPDISKIDLGAFPFYVLPFTVFHDKIMKVLPAIISNAMLSTPVSFFPVKKPQPPSSGGPDYNYTRTLSPPFTPGQIKLAPNCIHENPNSTNCPAHLPSENVLITAWHQMIYEELPNYDGTYQFNSARGGFSDTGAEIASYAIFDFPDGFEDKRCKWQFVSDGGSFLIQEPNEFDVFTVDGNADLKTTWNSGPKRKKAVARFIINKYRKTNRSLNQKELHNFSSGPGGERNETFKCPKGGWNTWMIAPVRIEMDNGRENIFDVGGQLGLGIEIMGVDAGWG